VAIKKKRLEEGVYTSELVAFFLGFVAWLLPAQEIMPFTINCLLVLAALVVTGIVLWGWNETRGWVFRRRFGIWIVSMVVVFGALYPGLRKQYEREYDAGFQFKESPEINWWRAFLIRREFTKMHDYFHDLKIPVPEEVPPISVKHGKPDSLKYGVSMGGGDTPVYLQELSVAERDASESNISAFTDRYADYVALTDLHGMINRQPESAAEVQRDAERFAVMSNFGPYFNWSYWDKNLGRGYSWSDHFWNVRATFGQKYTDKLVAYTLKTFIDKPDEGNNPDMSAYFCYHLREAFGVVDNGAKRWSDIVAALGNPKLKEACPAN
jgi:hypothetical protein